MLNNIAHIINKQSGAHGGDLSISLFTGLGSLLQFHYMMYQQTKDAVEIQKMKVIASQIIDKINNYDFGNTTRLYSFSSGLSGVAFILTELQKKDIIQFDLQDEFSEINSYLYESAMQVLAVKNTDFLHGALGIFYYFLNHPRSAERDNYLQEMFGAFIKNCRIDEKGLRLYNFSSNEPADNDQFDTGLAHGLSGFLLILVECIRTGFETRNATHYLREGIRYLVSLEKLEKEEGGNESLFPTSVTEPFHVNLPENLSNYKGRLAWCYGDLNIAWVLIRGSEVLQSEDLFHKGVGIALNTTKRKTEGEALVGNFFFCHGSAGLSYLYKRLFDVTGHQQFNDAYLHWLGRLPQDLNGIELFEDFARFPNSTFSLLEGLIGLVPSYIADSSGNDIWNKTFLLN